MSKTGKTAILQPLQQSARMMRTILATRLLEHGLYAGQDAVLLKLAEEDGLPPGILAQRLGVRPPTVTKTISRLQAQGFVSKRPSANDQRQTHVFLTDRGHDVIRIIEKLVRKTEKDCLRGFEKKERKLLLKLLARMEHNLNAAASGRPLRSPSTDQPTYKIETDSDTQEDNDNE
ncbi:MarR family winged helix-turn-helix transcriptional regulator [Pseudochrobactrum sp. MP213Fo]|uniref:MarR family winged helix-turn-helix transcriptional regulator n=1 Tax=Pseudochrobactrum sp. MP213Fo TaxID=3022250 RepID=UPI003BA0739F